MDDKLIPLICNKNDYVQEDLDYWSMLDYFYFLIYKENIVIFFRKLNAKLGQSFAQSRFYNFYFMRFEWRKV